MRRLLPLLVALLAGLPVAAGEDPAPSAAERVAEMKADLAMRHVRVAAWAAGRKLRRQAEIELRLALRLDPDCAEARERLAGLPEKPADLPAAARHEAELARRRHALFEREVSAFQALGLALAAGGEEARARPLLRRVCLLAPDPTAAGAALSLVRRGLGLLTAREAKALEGAPAPERAEGPGIVHTLTGTTTTIRRRGAVLVETVLDADGAAHLARVTDDALRLTTARFGFDYPDGEWVLACVARDYAQYCRCLDESGLFSEPRLSGLKRLGALRNWEPRHFFLTWPVHDTRPKDRDHLLVHMAAEDVLYGTRGDFPPWMIEATGIDATLLVLATPGRSCAKIEQSAGIAVADPFRNPLEWGERVYRAAAAGTLPGIEELDRHQIQALTRDHLIASHATLRYLALFESASLAAYAKALAAGEKRGEAFRKAFGGGPEVVDERFRELLLGG